MMRINENDEAAAAKVTNLDIDCPWTCFID
jgi:hypothetical protein